MLNKGDKIMINLFNSLVSATKLTANFSLDKDEFIELLKEWSNDWGIYEMFSNGNTVVLNLVMETSGWNFNNVILTTNLYDYGNTIKFQIDYKTDYQARQYITLGDNRTNDFFASDVYSCFVQNEPAI